MQVKALSQGYSDYESRGQLAAATGQANLFKLMLSFQVELDPLSHYKRVNSAVSTPHTSPLPNDYRSIPLSAALSATAWTRARKALEQGAEYARLELYAHPQPLIDSIQLQKIPIDVLQNCGLAARQRLAAHDDLGTEENPTLLHDLIPQAEEMRDRLIIPH